MTESKTFHMPVCPDCGTRVLYWFGTSSVAERAAIAEGWQVRAGQLLCPKCVKEYDSAGDTKELPVHLFKET